MYDIKNNIEKDIFDISNKILNAGFSLYLVGGSIRDIILGKKIEDYDFATNAKPDQLKKIFPKAILFGEKFGTIMLIIRKSRVEITTLRKESNYTDHRHPQKVEFISDIKEDLKRRDFTINSIAYDMKSDNIIDLFGGINDLNSKIIRSVGNPDDRFREDALRLMRGVRFAFKLGFEIEDSTYKSIVKNSKLINEISSERIRDEFMKIVNEDKSSYGIELLRKTEILSNIIPELVTCLGVEQNKYHSLDVYHHLLLSLDSADKKVKLAALFHDIGKPQTKDGEHFFGHEKVGAEITYEILNRLKFPNEQIEITCKLINLHLFHYEPSWSDSAVRRFLRKVGDKDTLELLFLLRIADEKGNPISNYDFDNLSQLKSRIDSIEEKDRYLKLKDLSINGNDLLKIGYKKDRKLGEALELLLDKVIDNPNLNNRKDLISIAKKNLFDTGEKL